MTRESFFKGLKRGYLNVCQTVGATIQAPSNRQIQVALFLIGVTLLVGGMATKLMAQSTVDVDDRGIQYNDTRIADAVATILTMLEGTFGALVMVAAGLGAILSSAFGQYRAALGCLIVAVGAFILRSVMTTFFNTESVSGLEN